MGEPLVLPETTVAVIVEPATCFEDFVLASRRGLFRFAVVLCGDSVRATDLVTDVLGKAFERWPQVSGADNPYAYARRMVVNEFISQQRKHGRVVPLPSLIDLAGTTPDHGIVSAERDGLIAQLDQLSAPQRAAIVLRYYEDLDDEQIARVLGCRIGTVRSHISRGLARLRVELSAESESV